MYQAQIIGVASSLNLPFTGIADVVYPVADIGGLNPDAIDNNPAVSVSNLVRDSACRSAAMPSESFFMFSSPLL
jgi:hypothetical protein